MLGWIEGVVNPADLVSKEHCPTIDVLNGKMWRAGPEIFISGPIEDNIRTFAFLKNDKFSSG